MLLPPPPAPRSVTFRGSGASPAAAGQPAEGSVTSDSGNRCGSTARGLRRRTGGKARSLGPAAGGLGDAASAGTSRPSPAEDPGDWESQGCWDRPRESRARGIDGRRSKRGHRHVLAGPGLGIGSAGCFGIAEPSGPELQGAVPWVGGCCVSEPRGPSDSRGIFAAGWILLLLPLRERLGAPRDVRGAPDWG